MNALLLIAHGSRKQTSNDEVRALTGDLAQMSAHKFEIVECAFLELAKPSIPEGITVCVEKGAKNVIVLPYFLSAGRHVSEDIPAELNKAIQIHPQLKIKVAPHLGSSTRVCDNLLALSELAYSDG